MTRPIRRRALLALAAGGAAAVAAPAVLAQAAGDDEAYGGYPGTTIRFASVEAARAVLGADDEWMRATSPFQRRAVMGSAAPVTLAAFRRWNESAAQPWPAESRQRWRHALDTVVPALAALKVPLPPEVLLIDSNGQESAGAPYTRGHAVVITREAGHFKNDAFLLAHELWHVASRHAPALATRLYALFGFEPVPELAFPEAWADIRIANPDAPNNRHALRAAMGGDGERHVWLTPVLVASRTRLEPGESFFQVLDVRLLEVSPDAAAGVTRAVLAADGQPRWQPLQGAHGYLQRLGGNTGYIIHVEEALADNIALLATGAPVRNPALLARIRETLATAPG
jgi:hypothetical protein